MDCHKVSKGFPTDEALEPPQVELCVSRSGAPAHVGLALAEEYGIPRYGSISAALCLGKELAVDGAHYR